MNLCPQFLIKNSLFRLAIRTVLPTFDRMGDNVYNHFYPYVIQKIKEHQQQHDDANPRDYLDFLISETKSNKKIGWHSLINTIFSLYLGGSDTIATTMRWVMVSIAKHQHIQQKCQREIDNAIDMAGEATADNCPYLSGLLFYSKYTL